MSPATAPVLALRRVCVGTTNVPKITAVRLALGAFLADVEVQGQEVKSGVSEQPVGFEEIVRGARNRADAAWKAAPCDLGVGIEDGLVVLPGVEQGPFNVGCAALTDGRQTWLGFSSGFSYPPECARRAVEGGEPIGELFDRLWEQHREAPGEGPSGRSVGNVGKLSLGILPRAEYARHAVVCALLPLLHRDLYPDPEVAA